MADRSPMTGIQPFNIPGKNTPRDNEPIQEEDDEMEQTHEAQTPKMAETIERHFPDDSSSDDLSREVQRKLEKEKSLKASIAQILDPEAQIKDLDLKGGNPYKEQDSRESTYQIMPNDSLSEYRNFKSVTSTDQEPDGASMSASSSMEMFRDDPTAKKKMANDKMAKTHKAEMVRTFQ